MSTSSVASRTPLVSVVIATRNRASMLRESLHSVLSQSFDDFEVVIVDDGSEDNTREVVEQIDDPRVRYVHQESAGISVARNTGADHSRGFWTAVHDDDDIMLPFRLEQQLRQADDTVDFVYGAFINFDDETGALQLHHGRNYGYGAALMSGFAPGHSTWLVRTELLRRFRYDEGIESAVDNNLTFRMLRSGIRFRHSGVVCLLRRVHSGRITDQGGKGQKYVAQMNLAFLKRGISNKNIDEFSKEARFDWGPVDKTDWQTRYLPYLPDRLVKRTGYLTTRELLAGSDERAAPPTLRVGVDDVGSLDWFQFFDRCRSGADMSQVHARLKESEDIERSLAEVDVAPALNAPAPQEIGLVSAIGALDDAKKSPYLGVAIDEPESWTDEQLALTEARCVIRTVDGDLLVGVVPFRSWHAARSMRASTFSTSRSFRVLSTRSVDDIATDVRSTN